MTCDGLASCPEGVEILLAASCYRNWDKLRPDEPVGSKGFTSSDHNRDFLEVGKGRLSVSAVASVSRAEDKPEDLPLLILCVSWP